MILSRGGLGLAGRYQDRHAQAPGGPGSSPLFGRYVASALAGEFDFDAMLRALDAETDDQDEGVFVAYKLLNVAVDFGDVEAEEHIDALVNAIFYHNDDDGFVRGDAHCELGLGYLRGTDGLPVDPDKGRAHLERAYECRWPFHVDQAELLLSEVRAMLTPAQLAVFGEVYGAP